MFSSISKFSLNPGRVSRIAIWAMVLFLLFGVYTIGIRENPPGFYIDESGLAYNAYLISKTGAPEMGPKWPLFVQIFTDDYVQYSNPTPVYLLAAVFSVVGPSILAARMVAAGSMFLACILLGSLAAKISGRQMTGVIVGGLALTSPWLFEIGRVAFDPFFYPAAVVLFLWAVYLAYRKGQWDWKNILAISLCLTLVTYSYTIGRLAGPLFAFGLISFASNRKQVKAVLATWGMFALTMIPFFVLNQQNPGLSRRFYRLSYIKPKDTIGKILPQFITHYFQDLDPYKLLVTGDTLARHHIQNALGSIYFGVFILALIGLIVVVVKKRNDVWWRFVLFGLAASAVPGALTIDRFHTLRMIAYPIFLPLLTIPALEWMFDRGAEIADGEGNHGRVGRWQPKAIFAIVLLCLTLMQAGYFHYKYYTEGPSRSSVFDVSYKHLYDLAVEQPDRPIYLLDGGMGPSYIHALWYATVEGRSTSEFVHLMLGEKPPPGSLILSSEPDCYNCDLISKEQMGVLYRSRPEPDP